jgi:hypothetical protein
MMIEPRFGTTRGHVQAFQPQNFIASAALGIEESVCKARDIAWFCKIPTGFASVQSYENEQPWVICLCTRAKLAKISPLKLWIVLQQIRHNVHWLPPYTVL